MAYFGKIGRRNLNNYLYLGTGLAVLTSLFLGWMILVLYGSLPKGVNTRQLNNKRKS